MPNTSDKKEFHELVIGATFSPGFAHIIEKDKDLFPDRPLGTYMKTGENKAVWLRTGQEREFMPDQLVIEQKLLIMNQ